MPSLSQLFGVKKGSNSSPTTSRQGFFPFSRKWSSASSRGRQHLRSKSDNTVVCHNGHGGARSTDGLKRSPPVSGCDRDDREPYEARYERYRQIYLATSPERELSTLNAALLNVRKWLKKKHQVVTSLQHSLPDSLQHSQDAAQQWEDTAAGPCDDSLQTDQVELLDKQALLEKLVKEAGDQQEAVDVLLDRGRRYLAQRACITLEVDLDNLAFLWTAYTKQLHLLHRSHNDPLCHLAHLDTPEGKENVYLDLTPVKWRRGSKGASGRQLSPVTSTPIRQPSPVVSERHGVPVTPRQQRLSAFSSERNGALDFVPDSENSDLSFDQSGKCQLAPLPTPDQSVSSFATQKEVSLGSQPSVAPDTNTAFCKGELKESEAAVKPRRKLPSIPVSSSSAEATPPDKQQGEARHATRGRKPSSPRSERTKVITASLWPGEGNSGWLKVAGEGIFSKSPRQHSEPRSARSDPRPSPQSLRDHSSAPEAKALAPEGQAVPVSANTCMPPVCGTGVTQGTATEGLLGKRGKELHNELHHTEQQAQHTLPHRPEIHTQPDNPAHQAEQKDAATSHAPSVELQLPSGLTQSQEHLMMEMEDALREIRGSCSDSMVDLSDTTDNHRNNSSPTRDAANAQNTKDSDSLLLDDLDLPTGPKRRRLNVDTPSSLSSCSGSPLVSGDSSLTGTPNSSPAGTLQRDYKQRYKKDELWKAIESNYKYLMDKEIIETCQSTETALVGEGECEGQEVNPNVSYTHFLQQYQELMDWLNQAQRHTQRHLNSLSEKYLNQTYHEEMLEKCPQRECLTKYGHQLLLRYPSLCDQVTTRMTRLHSQWSAVEAAIAPPAGQASTDSMMNDLECDLTALRRWLNATESRLLPLTIRADWTDAELQDRLKQHQALQQDIESHSRIVSAVLKLSERLEQDRVSGSRSCPGSARDCDSVQLVALGLERRWHGIWLQSLEWQCRLEEAIHRRKGLYGSGLNFSSFNLPTLDESCSGGGSDLDLRVSGNITSGSNGSLLELSDDSLLFIGTRSERFIEDSPSPTFTRPSINSPTLSSPKLTNFLDRSSGDSANISECESKMGDSPRGVSLLQGRPDLSLSEGEVEVRGVTKGGPEARDVGYSSESQSNDETETMQQQIAMECRYAGIIEVSSDSPLGEKMAIPPSGGVRQDYYCMTHVDLDSTDKTTTTDDGNTTDDRENVARGVKGGQLPVQEDGEREGGGDSARGPLGVGRTEPARETGLNVNTNSTARGSGEDIEVKSWLESSDECDRAEREGAGPVDQRKVSMTEQPLLLVGSESDSATESQEKIRYLIDHAEDLVKTPPRPAAPPSPQRKTSPSKQTQTVTTATSSVESSCDASSENSDDSAGEEFSTATDDADDTLFDSVITLDGTADLTSLEDVSTIVSAPVTVDTARLRKQTGPRGGKKDRPWSVVGFQDAKKMDFNPLSTSESAIDREHPHTDTDSSSSHFVSVSHASTFPRRARSRVFQRAVSACEGSEQSSPRATKRKLKYSSSSSATDSQASRSSTTRVAVSTEDDDDDRTVIYDSVERLRCQGRPPCLLETESETTDEYVTASMDEVMTSADEDPHNSTGSFSENAWDNYQMMYPTASEDATEEVLHWEPVDDMEFDDDFTFTVPKTSVLKEAITTTANKQLKQTGGGCEDSDSDMEDFHSVLEDSESCLKLVDRSLKKKRSNPMGSGLAAHAKYAEILATCETNIVCMKNVCSHLTQEDIGINDVQRVQDLLYQWEKLHALAADRHQQSQQLSAVSESMATIKSTLTEARRCLTFDLFASREELETTINTLRVKGDKLDKQRQVIGEHRRVIDSFLRHHPAINVARFLEELTTLDKATTDTQQKVSSHLLDLENNWAVWVEYLEGQQELDALMATDRERLYTLLCQREAGHRVTKRDVLKELETLQSNLCVYEDKLHVLQAMRQRLTRVSDDSTQRAFLASLADLRNQLQVVSQRCRQMYRDVEDQDSTTDTDQSQLGRLAVSAATVQESYQANKNMSQLSCYDDLQSVVEEGCVYRAARRGRAWSWLRSVPVQIVALIMVAGLVYVLDPDILSDLASFSLTFTPELRHINGPPPL